MRSNAESEAKELPVPEDMSLSRTYSWLMSQMLYPDSRLQAMGAFVSDIVCDELRDHEPDFVVDLPLGWIRALVVAPSLDERGVQEQRRWKDGMTTGVAIGLVYAMQKCGVPDPSLNKAYEIMDSGKFGASVHRGQKEINKAKKLMEPVAHLWGAMAMLNLTNNRPKVVPGNEGLSTYLGWALALRRFGVSHKAKNYAQKGKTLLDPNICLRLPVRFQPTSDIEISLPLPPWALDIIAAYRAPMKF